MTRAKQNSASPEARLMASLTEAVRQGIDLSKVDFNQIPEAFRPQVKGMLSGLVEQAAKGPAVTVSTPDGVKKLVESLKLEEGFADAMETQRVFQLLKAGEKAPDFGQVLKAFTPEMLAAAQSFQNPTLVLNAKDRSFDDLVSAMDGHKTMPDQNDAYVDGLFRQHAGRKPETWGAHITEGSMEMEIHDFDDADLILGERLEKFVAHKKANGVNGMDRWKYIALMMKSLKNGQPIDEEFWTMLDEDPALSESRVPYAGWYPDPDDRRVDFGWDHPGDPGGVNRFRRSVGGDVPSV